jgi:hypothetical protein
VCEMDGEMECRRDSCAAAVGRVDEFGGPKKKLSRRLSFDGRPPPPPSAIGGAMLLLAGDSADVGEGVQLESSDPYHEVAHVLVLGDGSSSNGLGGASDSYEDAPSPMSSS